MAENVYLIGAEDVRSAASTMKSSADEMSRAASSIAHSLECHQRFMDDWLIRLDELLSYRVADLGQTLS